MIQDGVMFVCFLMAFTAVIAVAEKKIGGKFFKYVPGIVLIYIGAALMKTFGVFFTVSQSKVHMAPYGDSCFLPC